MLEKLILNLIKIEIYHNFAEIKYYKNTHQKELR